MMQSPNISPDDDVDTIITRLENVLSVLSQGLAGLDELGLEAAAGHVSHGYELTRQHLQSLQNGGTPVA